MEKTISNAVSLIIAIISVSVPAYLSLQLVHPEVINEQPLWAAGEDGVVLYRIPLLTYTPGGGLLAFCEARKKGRSDAGPKAIAVRRSDDLGQTWTPQQFLHSDPITVEDGLNLGAVVVDSVTETIFVIYVTCAHYYHCDISSTYYIKSVDDGHTWSKPYNLSQQIGTKSFAPGPGYGIQKKYAPNKGRLIVCGHGSTGPRDGLFCILSDDHGETWRYGGSMKSIPYNHKKVQGDFVPDEAQPVEFPDGSVMVNVRNQRQYHCHCRMVVMSYDGGETFKFDDLRLDSTLVDPTVAASILYHGGVLFFTNPNNDKKRINMTLRWSYDNGTTWESSLNIWPRGSGYSTMTALPDDDKFIYILYEKGTVSSNQYIYAVKVSLTGGI